MQAEACNFINNETLAHVFSSEFCEFFKNIFLTEHLQVTIFNSFNKAMSTNWLTHFMPLVSFYTTWKYQKASSFLMFLRGIERDH